MTRTEIPQAIAKLTEDIRTLISSSTKAAAEKILPSPQRRRELRAQLEAAEPSGATADKGVNHQGGPVSYRSLILEVNFQDLEV